MNLLMNVLKLQIFALVQKAQHVRLRKAIEVYHYTLTDGGGRHTARGEGNGRKGNGRATGRRL